MNNTFKMMLGAGFAIAVGFYANALVDHTTHSGFLVLAAIFGTYMAMNIGANDVANNSCCCNTFCAYLLCLKS